MNLETTHQIWKADETGLINIWCLNPGIQTGEEEGKQLLPTIQQSLVIIFIFVILTWIVIVLLGVKK